MDGISVDQDEIMEVFFFGAPADDLRFTEEQLPTWADGGKYPFFGVPGNHWRGFEIANDTSGSVIDRSIRST